MNVSEWGSLYSTIGKYAARLFDNSANKNTRIDTYKHSGVIAWLDNGNIDQFWTLIICDDKKIKWVSVTQESDEITLYYANNWLLIPAKWWCETDEITYFEIHAIKCDDDDNIKEVCKNITGVDFVTLETPEDIPL